MGWVMGGLYVGRRGRGRDGGRVGCEVAGGGGSEERAALVLGRWGVMGG